MRRSPRHRCSLSPAQSYLGFEKAHGAQPFAKGSDDRTAFTENHPEIRGRLVA
jgi:hypothetical protein